MSLKYFSQQEETSKVDQGDSSEQKIVEVKAAGSNPLIIPDTDNTKFNTGFDMLTEGLW